MKPRRLAIVTILPSTSEMMPPLPMNALGVVGVVHQHPVEGGRKARLLRLRSVVDRGAPVVIGPRRRRHAVERVSRQRVVAKARQEFPVGSADGVAIESVGAGLEDAMLIHRNGFLACN